MFSHVCVCSRWDRNVSSNNHQVSLAGSGYVSSDSHQVSLVRVGISMVVGMSGGEHVQGRGAYVQRYRVGMSKGEGNT